jgi:hypothetical protein
VPVFLLLTLAGAAPNGSASPDHAIIVTGQRIPIDKSYGECVLPHAEVRESRHPERVLGEFFHSAYEAGANLARWDRTNLERKPVAPQHQLISIRCPSLSQLTSANG